MARVKIGNVFPSDEYLLSRCAPAGYGLGTVNGHDCIDCNTAVLNGVYYVFGESATNHPGNNMQYGCMVVYRRGVDITQIIHYDYYEAKRFSKNGGSSWGKWEWVNPPMNIGTEYRTTERYMGKPVYASLVNVGEYPESGLRDVDTGIVATGIVRFNAVSGYYALPLADNMDISVRHNGETFVVRLNTKGERIIENDVYVTLYYIKD